MTTPFASWILACVLSAAALAVLLTGRRALLDWIEGRNVGAAVRFRRLLRFLLGWPAQFGAVLIAVALLLGLAPLPNDATSVTGTILRCALVAALALAAREALRLARAGAQPGHPLRRSVVHRSAECGIFALAALMILAVLDVPIAPILVPGGILGAAVVFSARGVIGDLLMGFFLSAGGPVREGDYIRIDGGPEGQVRELGWVRSRLIAPDDTLINVPNRLLLDSSIQYLGSSAQSILLEARFTAGPGAPLKKIKASTLTAARTALATRGDGASDGAPAVIVESVGAQGPELRVILPARDASAGESLRDAFWVALDAEFRRAGLKFGG